ncbi:MAG: PH domain-containing protein, partial [Oscillospiraceae bacterium]|nr:PH domain-containing protein [Oscillospiraceae bacterium]
MHREHPLRALRRSTRSIWLLIFPLLRGAYHIASAEEVMVWLRGAWFDLLILLAILGYGVLDWFFREFTVENGQIYVQEGILVTRRRYLPLRNLTALTIEHPFWMWPIGASYVYADTAAGLLSSTDIRLMIRMRDESLFLSAAPHVRQGRRHHAEHKGGFWRILLFSVIFSNSFTGLLYIVVFLFQFRRIVQDLITEFQLNDRFNEVSENVSRKLSGIPPIVVTVIIVLAAAWLLSLMINILRYGKFDMHSDRHTVSIHSGLLTRRNHILVAEKVNYADLRQNLWTKLFRVYSLAVSIPGYGNQRGSIPIWLPIQTRREIDEALPMLFPDYRRTRR